MKTALLIPIYEPSARVLPFLSSIPSDSFDYFYAVDDGSGEAYKEIFDSLASTTSFKVISYPKNKGKGRALKIGVASIRKEHPEVELILTADSDGQHSLKDILHLKEEAESHPDALLLGSRDFSCSNVPSRNRAGNRFSSFYFRLTTRKKVYDTQTGLRAIPSILFDLALETPGERFEYEMNFLLSAVKETDVVEIPIETIYEENGGSHFRPVRDSLRIYKTPLLYLLVSLTSFGVDIGLFHLLSNFVFTTDMEQRVFLSAFVARVASGLYNFLMFHFLVFKKEEKFGRKALKYSILWSLNYGLSSGLTYLFNNLPASLTFIKFVVDVFLAIVNYLINLTWVFAKKRRKKKNKKKTQEEAKAS